MVRPRKPTPPARKRRPAMKRPASREESSASASSITPREHQSELSSVPKNPSQVQPQRTTWENIVLHYLSKLKNYWTSSDAPCDFRCSNRQCNCTEERQINNPMEWSTPEEQKFLNKESEVLKRRLGNSQHSAAPTNRRKIINIVSNALQYGLANGVVTKNGQYFCVDDKQSEESFECSSQSDVTRRRNKTKSKPLSLSKAKTIKIDKMGSNSQRKNKQRMAVNNHKSCNERTKTTGVANKKPKAKNVVPRGSMRPSYRCVRCNKYYGKNNKKRDKKK